MLVYCIRCDLAVNRIFYCDTWRQPAWTDPLDTIRKNLDADNRPIDAPVTMTESVDCQFP